MANITNKEYTVFLVDDDKMFIASLRHSIMQQFGTALKISEYSSGEECMAGMEDIPDICILDYNLNDGAHPSAINGITLLQEIKAISKNSIVIMLSAQDTLEVAADSIKNGAYEYIPKNSLIRIENTLKNAIENIKSSRESSQYLKWVIGTSVFIFAIILIDVIRHYN